MMSVKVETDILGNAVSSIQMGVEDLDRSDEDPRRALSAIRNFYSGVLLLLKERLRRESEELIHANLQPKARSGGGVQWIGKGKNTVDSRQMEQRWKSLGWRLDWAPLGSLREVRNDVEHRTSDRSVEQLQRAVSDTYHLVTDVLAGHLNESPHRLLGHECWERIVEVGKDYDGLRKLAFESRKKVPGVPPSAAIIVAKWLECWECGSDALSTVGSEPTSYSEAELVCEVCTESAPLLDMVLELASRDESLERCPDCGLSAFSHEAEGCFACDYELEYRECEICEEILGLEEQEFEGLCGRHYSQLNEPDYVSDPEYRDQ